jgi:hypothetical protein
MNKTNCKLILAAAAISLLTVSTSRASLGCYGSSSIGCDNSSFWVTTCQPVVPVTVNCTPPPTKPKPTPNITAVPEPSTIVAGALLLLPFGISTVRILRKNKQS